MLVLTSIGSFIQILQEQVTEFASECALYIYTHTP